MGKKKRRKKRSVNKKSPKLVTISAPSAVKDEGWSLAIPDLHLPCFSPAVAVAHPSDRDFSGEGGQDQVRYIFGLNALKQQDHEKAVTYFEEAIEINPRHAPAHACLSIQYCARGDLDRAEGHAQKTIELGGRKIGLNALGGVYLQRGDV